jgi:hypothetical protein
MDVVGKGLLTVDFDDRDQLPVPGLELRVAADVGLAQLEPELVSELAHLTQCTLTEVATLRVVDDDLGRYGYSPRVIVASATRPTATP